MDPRSLRASLAQAAQRASQRLSQANCARSSGAGAPAARAVRAQRTKPQVAAYPVPTAFQDPATAPAVAPVSTGLMGAPNPHFLASQIMQRMAQPDSDTW